MATAGATLGAGSPGSLQCSSLLSIWAQRLETELPILTPHRCQPPSITPPRLPIPIRRNAFVNALFQDGLPVDFTTRGQTVIELWQTLPVLSFTAWPRTHWNPCLGANTLEVLESDAGVSPPPWQRLQVRVPSSPSLTTRSRQTDDGHRHNG